MCIFAKLSFQLFRKLFWVKPQSSKDNMTVVRAAGIQVRQQVIEKYFQYDLPSSNQDWKEKWFYVDNHKPQLPMMTG
jgi:hypothetical protein